MLSFATIILDLELNYSELHDYEGLRKEFIQNLKGINEGHDFKLDFIKDLF